MRVAVRHPNLAMYLLPAGNVGQIEIRKTNVRDADDVKAALRGADAAVNLVGVLYQRGHQSFEELHVGAAETIAKAAAGRRRKPLVHLSAIGADEDAASAYAASKGKGEARCARPFPARRSCVPRSCSGRKTSSSTASLAGAPVAGAAADRRRAHQVPAGLCRRCGARGGADALSDTATRGKTYELGGPDVYTFKELMELILRVTCRSRAARAGAVRAGEPEGVLPAVHAHAAADAGSGDAAEERQCGGEGALTLADLGITADSVEAIVPSYLWRFRPKGQYEPAGTRRRVSPTA